jgi:transposase
MGNLLSVVVHSAGIQDRAGARAVLVRLYCAFRTIKTVFVDGGYSGALIEWTLAMFGWSMQVVKRIEQHTFVVLPKRWIVERTLSWLGWSRRLSKDYELLPCNSEAFLKIAMIHLLLKRAHR